MRKRNTESLGEVLQQFFEENIFLKNKIAESRIISGWSAILGKAVSSYTNNLYFRNGVLYVHLTSSVLRAELMACKEKLIISLNRHAETNVVNDIIFK